MAKLSQAPHTYFVIPSGIATEVVFPFKPRPARAEKPEVPDELEEHQYIYRPNDPFQFQIDQARAMASIGSSHVPWVRKAWFLLFIIWPPAQVALQSILSVVQSNTDQHWSTFGSLFIRTFTPILPIWLLCLYVWHRKIKSQKEKNT